MIDMEISSLAGSTISSVPSIGAIICCHTNVNSEEECGDNSPERKW